MRYIDADALIKKIYPMGIGDGKYTINAKAVKLAIDNAPTADWYSMEDKHNEEIARTAIDVRIMVANEIIDEIENIVKKNTYRHENTDETEERHNPFGVLHELKILRLKYGR